MASWCWGRQAVLSNSITVSGTNETLRLLMFTEDHDKRGNHRGSLSQGCLRVFSLTREYAGIHVSRRVAL